MMLFEKNFLIRGRKSRIKIISGILFILFAISYIIVKAIEYQQIRIFDGFYSLFFALGGIVYILEGCNTSFFFERLFGEAYMRIDDDKISIKVVTYEREKVVFWQEIDSIRYDTNRFIVKKRDGSEQISWLVDINAPLNSEDMKIIEGIAEGKGVAFTY